MGLLATLLLSVIFGILGVVRPRVATYFIVALFVLFDEQGAGFTTFRGSFVFNAFFVGFYGLRLIEALTLSAYIPMLLMAFINPDKGTRPSPFKVERVLVILFSLWIALLSAVEFGLAGKATYSDWRLIVTGVIQFHMLIMVFREEADVERLVRLLLVMLSMKAAYGLAMYAAGHGTMSLRGRLPFFWDGKQIEAFGLGAVILTGYILNFSAIRVEHRRIPIIWALLMWLLLVAAVGGSIRRTIWVTTFLGMFGVLILSRRTTILHYFVVMFAGSVIVAGLLLAPGLDDFRDHMGKYVESMNLLDDNERSGNIENEVHINNVEQYAKMVTEKSDILALGIHGPSGVHYYEILMGAYSEGGYRLGMAHNGVLRTILFFGIPGLLIYLTFYITTAVRTWRIYRLGPDDHWLKHVAVGCGLFMFLDFASALVFVPPFYTASKGLFYTFLEVFIVGFVASRIVPNTRRSNHPNRARGDFLAPARSMR